MIAEELFRREIIEKVVDDVCRELLSNEKRVRVGVMHEHVANRLNVFSSAWLKTQTNERLKDLKIKRVIVNGYSFFRKQR